MRVCYFGIYNPEYSRNKILISGLEKNNVDVIRCVSNKKGIFKYFDLVKKHWNIRKSYDVMIVGYPGFQCVILAKILTKKPIIFDAFVSLYDSMVLDRKIVSIFSFKALYFWILDKISMNMADLVLMDTNEHKNYIVNEFNVDAGKVERVFIGADTDIFFPRNKTKDHSIFRVLFYGTYIPLQGVEYIVRAAKVLEDESDIEFKLIGNGQEKAAILDLIKQLKVKNIKLIDNIPQSLLGDKIDESDVCLGIFGDTNKTQRVIPNKVYECVSMRKAVITSDTPAIRELFSQHDMFLVEAADFQSIANAILTLKKDRILLDRLALGAYSTFQEKVVPTVIAQDLINIIKNKYEKKS